MFFFCFRLLFDTTDLFVYGSSFLFFIFFCCCCHKMFKFINELWNVDCEFIMAFYVLRSVEGCSFFSLSISIKLFFFFNCRWFLFYVLVFVLFWFWVEQFLMLHMKNMRKHVRYVICDSFLPHSRHISLWQVSFWTIFTNISHF